MAWIQIRLNSTNEKLRKLAIFRRNRLSFGHIYG